jgi:cell division protein FtsZ
MASFTKPAEMLFESQARETRVTVEPQQASIPQRPEAATMPISTASVSQEEKSDFDRFMSDRNSFGSSASQAQEEANAAPASQSQAAPSRLIQQIRDAANKYENPSRPAHSVSPNTISEASLSSTNTRAKSIAEKLGFINFDEDEFDTPSYLRKEDKSTDAKPATREFKNLDL